MAAAVAKQGPRPIRPRGGLPSRLLMLACGATVGFLAGVSIAWLGGSSHLARSSGSSSDDSSSGSQSRRSQALIRGGGDGPSSPPPYDAGAEADDVSTARAPLQGVAWAAHDPVAGKVATDLWLWRDLTVHILPGTPPPEAMVGFLTRLLPGFLEHPRWVRV